MGSSSKTTKQSTNPYQDLPQWALDYYKRDAGIAEELNADARDIARDLAGNPRMIYQLSEDERAGVDRVLQQADRSGLLLDEAHSALTDGRHESRYIDDVVDTTLAGMTREANRQRMQRGGQEAAIGGPSNTRMAVADALQGQLVGMDMAQMEANLRDDAQRWGVEAGLSEAGALSGLARTGMDMAETAGQYQSTRGELDRTLRQQSYDENRTSEQQASEWLSGVFSQNRQLPTTGGGRVTTQEPGPSRLGQALGVASSVAGIWSMLSDDKAKTDIKPEKGALDKLGLLEAYTYRYRPGLGHTDQRTTGLMAPDIARAGIEGAVMRGEDGYLRVDPYPVLTTVVQGLNELNEKVNRVSVGLPGETGKG